MSVGRDVSSFFPTVVRGLPLLPLFLPPTRGAPRFPSPDGHRPLTPPRPAPQVINIATSSFEVKNLVYIYLVRCVLH